jgi:hypothetical protein
MRGRPLPKPTAGAKRSVIAMKSQTGLSQWEGLVGRAFDVPWRGSMTQMMHHDKARVMGVEISLLYLFIAVIAALLTLL